MEAKAWALVCRSQTRAFRGYHVSACKEPEVVDEMGLVDGDLTDDENPQIY
jgi:hypothetical protein